MFERKKNAISLPTMPCWDQPQWDVTFPKMCKSWVIGQLLEEKKEEERSTLWAFCRLGRQFIQTLCLNISSAACLLRLKKIEKKKPLLSTAQFHFTLSLFPGPHVKKAERNPNLSPVLWDVHIALQSIYYCWDLLSRRRLQTEGRLQVLCICYWTTCAIPVPVTRPTIEDPHPILHHHHPNKKNLIIFAVPV